MTPEQRRELSVHRPGDFDNLEVCLVCFHIRGKFKDWEQRCDCQVRMAGRRGPRQLERLLQLCRLCFGSLIFVWVSVSPVCRQCHRIAGAIRQSTGGGRWVQVQMNPDESERLMAWSIKEMRILADSAGLGRGEIPLAVWNRLCPVFFGASADALCRFANSDFPDDPELSRLGEELAIFREVLRPKRLEEVRTLAKEQGWGSILPRSEDRPSH